MIVAPRGCTAVVVVVMRFDATADGVPRSSRCRPSSCARRRSRCARSARSWCGAREGSCFLSRPSSLACSGCCARRSSRRAVSRAADTCSEEAEAESEAEVEVEAEEEEAEVETERAVRPIGSIRPPPQPRPVRPRPRAQDTMPATIVPTVATMMLALMVATSPRPSPSVVLGPPLSRCTLTCRNGTSCSASSCSERSVPPPSPVCPVSAPYVPRIPSVPAVPSILTSIGRSSGVCELDEASGDGNH